MYQTNCVDAIDSSQYNISKERRSKFAGARAVMTSETINSFQPFITVRLFVIGTDISSFDGF
jgi:hypothetical protein